jgi:hypothetical protein
MMLTKLERNAVFNAVIDGHLDPAECKFTITDNQLVIAHSSGSRLEIDLVGPPTGITIGRKFKGRAKVTDGGFWFLGEKGQSFDITLHDISNWAREVRQTLEAPDLWAELQRSRELITEIEQQDSGNAPFVQGEQREIAAQLQEITKQLKEQPELTDEQKERVEQWRDDAVEASTRMGRKDWYNYFLGTVTSLVITATVPGGIGEHVISVVIHGLAHLFIGGSEPPRILA